MYIGNNPYSGNYRYSGLQEPDRFFRYIRRLLYIHLLSIVYLDLKKSFGNKFSSRQEKADTINIELKIRSKRKFQETLSQFFQKKEQVKTQIASDLQFRILDLLMLHVKSNLTKHEMLSNVLKIDIENKKLIALFERALSVTTLV